MTTTLITPAPATPAVDGSALAEAVARDGVEAHLGAVCALAMTARERGLAEVLVGIVVDESAPAVARERAFGRLLVALAR